MLSCIKTQGLVLSVRQTDGQTSLLNLNPSEISKLAAHFAR